MRITFEIVPSDDGGVRVSSGGVRVGVYGGIDEAAPALADYAARRYLAAGLSPAEVRTLRLLADGPKRGNRSELEGCVLGSVAASLKRRGLVISLPPDHITHDLTDDGRRVAAALDR